MLPAYGKAKIGDFVLGLVNGENQRLFFGKKVQDAVNCAETNFHLYFLSDEEIKEGDWMFHMLDEKPAQWNGEEINPSVYGYKKIVATTDKLMLDEQSTFIYGYKAPLPQPSQSFIEYFVEEYNKGNVITEVEVEYENEDMDFDPAEPNDINWVKKLKINPDNTINTKLKKESWSREEVIGLIKKFTKDTTVSYDIWQEEFDKWIKENL